MLLLESHNRIIFDTIQQLIDSDKREPLDITVADFDGVLFHLSTPEAKNLLNLSLQWGCAQELLTNGAQKDLEQIYGPLLVAPEAGYDVTIQLDLDNLPADKDKLPLKFAFLKRHLLAAPFKKTFGAIHNKKPSNNIIKIAYRQGEAFYIKPEDDRCMVIYQILFSDETDKVLAKLFLSEFADARKPLRGAPDVKYLAEPPSDLSQCSDLEVGPGVGYVSFVLFENHLIPANAFKTINLIQSFRDYLHYHIKCSKAYMHTRMRNQVANWLQVLNRARNEPFQKKEKKLASGRTFKRK